MAATYSTPRNIFGHEKLRKELLTLPAADVDTDSSGDITITFGHLRHIVEDSVKVSLEGGYVANVISVSGNTATVRIYQGDYDQSSDAALAAVASGSDIAILHAEALGW